MSGGSFNYAYMHTSNFADELGCKLDEFDKVDDWEQKPNYFEPAVLAKLREIKTLAERAALLMKEAEWLYSGDTGEESFLRRVAAIEGKK